MPLPLENSLFSPRSKVRFIRFYFTHKLLEFLHLMPVDRQAEIHIPAIGSFPIESQKFMGLSGCQVETKALNNFFNFVIGDFLLFKHISRLNHFGVMV
jgi:hypothetical protein